MSLSEGKVENSLNILRKLSFFFYRFLHDIVGLVGPRKWEIVFGHSADAKPAPTLLTTSSLTNKQRPWELRISITGRITEITSSVFHRGSSVQVTANEFIELNPGGWGKEIQRAIRITVFYECKYNLIHLYSGNRALKTGMKQAGQMSKMTEIWGLCLSTASFMPVKFVVLLNKFFNLPFSICNLEVVGALLLHRNIES